MKIYLAGSIWYASEAEASNWRLATEDILGKDQCLNPLRRDYLGRVPDHIKEVVVLDKLDIRNSDALLVCFDTPSVGTSMEVFYAWTLEKPIVVVNKSGLEVPPWLAHHATVVYADFSDAITWLEKHIA